jgi:hypothetical protein
MVDQLPGEAPLEIGHGRPIQEASKNHGHGRPLVQMTVDHIGPEAPGRSGRRDQEQEVETGPVDRKADRQLTHPGEPHGPHGADLGDIAANVIGGDQDLHVVTAEGADFLKDANVAAAVAEERRRRDHEHTHSGSRRRAVGQRSP